MAIVFYPIWLTWLNFFFGLATRGLLFLPNCAKSSLSKFNFIIFVGSIYFPHGIYSFAELEHDGFVKPVRTAASTRNIAAATWLHVSPMPTIQVQWHDQILANFSKVVQSLWNGSLTDWGFLHSPFRMQKLLPVSLWYKSGCNQPDLW